MKALLLTIALAIVAAVSIAAIGGAGLQAESARAGHARAALTPFGSCDRLRGYLQRHRDTFRTVMPPLADGAAIAGEASGEAPAQASPAQTNVQEQGVDEPDLVKTRGSTLFSIVGDDRLRAVDLSGSAPAVLDSIELPDGPGAGAYAETRELLLAGDRALVISRTYGSGGSRTVLTEIDVSEPGAMIERATEVVGGDYVSARLSGATARVVVAAYPQLPIAEHGHGRAWLPRSVLHDRIDGQTSRDRLVSCEDVRRPRRFSGTEMVSVLTIDLARGLPAVDTDAVMAGGEIVYSSPTSLYVATERWLAPPVASELPPGGQVRTEIHRFDVSGSDSTDYVASGAVEGYMLDQWSMSEHDGVLRVASTSEPPWLGDVQGGESESFVTALQIDGERLTAIGRVGGLGRGEQIYAVRFIGELGYVVTFRQVDPLYVIDLSDPSDPRTLGELKIPGYSAYLHPVADGLLLGVGQDATRDGQTTGVQVSLFDVSDPTAPVRVDRESLGRGTSTEVEYDHHAFTYDPARALALMPIESWMDPERQYAGAIGIRLDPLTGLERTQRVSHGPGFRAAIRRSLIVGERVFTVSARGVAEHDPLSLEPLAFTPYAGD